ncbi:MAG TPA: hypothetical protein VHD83_12015 [Puia sp.]|nr:hypothetical protein [Puia sp.]
MATTTLTNQATPFNDLREEGMELLRQRAGSIWTDHNLHDPGITILESLCYAFTELILKSGLDMPTLMGSINTDPKWPDLYEKNVLFNSPLTETDYRKLLLAHPSTRNAWLTPVGCPPVLYYDAGTRTVRTDNPAGTATPFPLKGLNSILIDLKDALSGGALPDTDLDLNNNIISRPATINPLSEQANFDIAFPFWDEIPVICSEGLPLNPIIATVTSTAVPLSYLATLDFTLTTGAGPVPVKIGVYVNILPKNPPLLSTQGQQMATIKTLLEDAAATAPVPVFLEKMKETAITVNELVEFLQQYRNLGEDPSSVKIVRTQEIAVEADLKLTSTATPELVLAQIYKKLDDYFTPAIPLHSAAELQAKGWTVDRIYEGPDLHGQFIDDTELPLADQEGSIHVSDLVNIFMETDGVEALEDFGISNYVNNLIITSHEHNCLVLVNPQLYKPRFSRGKSTLRIYQDDILHTPNQDLIILPAPAIPAPVTAVAATPVITDRTAEIGEYYSIQNEFPEVYALKEGELRSDADALRISQRLQLKAYLALFEQLMANYTIQLGKLKDIFSINPAIKTTYPWQPLYDVPGMAAVLNAFLDGGYADWTTFVNDAGNAYAVDAGTTDPDFISRRQLFLNHLLARAGHSPDDLSIWRYKSETDTESKIITQKCHFLADFPQLSAQRDKAYCYRKLTGIDVWDTDNVSGLEKRLAHFMDIQDFKRQNLSDSKEGFYLIEHILLRPLDGEPAPAPVLLPEANYSLSTSLSAWQTDPYSFRITIVLPMQKIVDPNDPPRFNDPNFQRRVERIVAIETPAHIIPEVYWINNKAVEDAFEAALKSWLDLLGQPVPVEEPARGTYLTNLSAAKGQVIKFLNHFRKSKYSTDVVPKLLAPPYIVTTPPV